VNKIGEFMTDKVTMKPGRYAMSRVGDGAGDSGGMLISIDPATQQTSGENGDIVKGCCIRCGSHFARTMQWQDYWTTTPVVEILEVNEDNSVVKFKTGNSVYEVKSF
jgi:hypothetical protein